MKICFISMSPKYLHFLLIGPSFYLMRTLLLHPSHLYCFYFMGYLGYLICLIYGKHPRRSKKETGLKLLATVCSMWPAAFVGLYGDLEQRCCFPSFMEQSVRWGQLSEVFLHRSAHDIRHARRYHIYFNIASTSVYKWCSWSCSCKLEDVRG